MSSQCWPSSAWCAPLMASCRTLVAPQSKLPSATRATCAVKSAACSMNLLVTISVATWNVSYSIKTCVKRRIPIRYIFFLQNSCHHCWEASALVALRSSTLRPCESLLWWANSTRKITRDSIILTFQADREDKLENNNFKERKFIKQTRKPHYHPQNIFFPTPFF